MANIVTLTVNPSVDVSSSVDRVQPDRKLRCDPPSHEPGGGGLNVARVVVELGGECRALWVSGGHTGRLLGRLLDGMDFRHTPIEIAEAVRENLVVYESTSGRQFRFTMPGPSLTEPEHRRVAEAVAALDPVPDYLVLSGSLPRGVDDEFYARIVRAAPDRTRVVVDASGGPLLAAMEVGVFLIKPNFRELTAMVGRNVTDDRDIEEVSREFIADGKAEVVVTSLGGGGAIAVADNRAYRLRAPTVPILSKVGAGDSMVGGIVVALSRGESVERAVHFGNAAGSAAVMTPGTGLCRREDTERLFRQMIEQQ